MVQGQRAHKPDSGPPPPRPDGIAAKAMEQAQATKNLDEVVKLRASAMADIGKTREYATKAIREAMRGQAPDWWKKLDEKAQKSLNISIDLAVGTVINDVVRIVAANGAPMLEVVNGIDEWKTQKSKSAVTTKLVLPLEEETVDFLNHHSSQFIILGTSAKAYAAKSDPLKPDVIGDLKIPENNGKAEGDEDDSEQARQRADDAAEAGADPETGELPGPGTIGTEPPTHQAV